MRVIIIGAGEVGSYIAGYLSAEGVDVAVIEKDSKRLNELAEDVNILGIQGSGLNSENLAKAGISSADMLVAVTANDEVNMLACLMAAQCNVKYRIVRIENDYLRDKSSRALREAMKVDVVIDPDWETANAILDLLVHPGVAEITELGKGRLTMIGSQLTEKSTLVNRKLAEIAAENEPDWNFIIGAISRVENKTTQTIIPRGAQYILEPGDTVRLVCKKEFTKKMLKDLGVSDSKARRIMVLGGGRIGTIVAHKLAKQGSTVTLVDRDPQRTEELSSEYDNINIIRGDITDPDILDEEEIGRMDAVVAATGKDESNVLACLYAQSKGVKEIIATLHSLELNNMFHQIGIKKTLSPTTASIQPVLKLLRKEEIKADVQEVRTFLAMDIEVLELTVASGSRADGMTITDLSPSKQILVGAVVNDEGAKIVRGKTRLLAGDHLVVFARPQALGKVSKLFETRN